MILAKTSQVENLLSNIRGNASKSVVTRPTTPVMPKTRTTPSKITLQPGNEPGTGRMLHRGLQHILRKINRHQPILSQTPLFKKQSQPIKLKSRTP
jgi:hypothetical protein